MDANIHNRIRFKALSFNPRARDGRESICIYSATPALVSIHAPVMDAKYSG